MILRHAALRVIDEGNVEPVTTLETLAEVREHLPVLAEKYGLDPKTLEANLLALGITAYGPKKYRGQLKEARRRIEAQDPDNVPLLALALALRLPVWSNDNDFRKAGVPWYTTAQLLRELDRSGHR
jgi:predicted nucleic acid-binding protein